jgi:hypothetical protein
MAKYLLNDTEMVGFTVGVTDIFFSFYKFPERFWGQPTPSLAADDGFYIRY